MSHINVREADTAEQGIKSLTALEAAAHRCGLVFRKGQTSFKCYATDYHEANSARMQELCRHAISAFGRDDCEIGVCESEKFPGTFKFAYDFYGSRGVEISARAGSSADKLTQFYHMEAARELALSQGYSYVENEVGNGQYDVEIDMTAVLGI